MFSPLQRALSFEDGGGPVRITPRMRLGPRRPRRKGSWRFGLPQESGDGPPSVRPVLNPGLMGDEDVPVNPFRSSLYTADELLGAFDVDRPGSYAGTLDFETYQNFVTHGRRSRAPLPSLDRARHPRQLHPPSNPPVHRQPSHGWDHGRAQTKPVLRGLPGDRAVGKTLVGSGPHPHLRRWSGSDGSDPCGRSASRRHRAIGRRCPCRSVRGA